MADNTRLNTGTGGDLLASDELATVNGSAAESGLKVQRVKVGHGADGAFNDVSSAAPLPVSVIGELAEAIENLRASIGVLSKRTAWNGTIAHLNNTTPYQRVWFDTSSNLNVVTTVTTVSNLNNIAGVSGYDMMRAQNRSAYNSGVRSKLTFS